MATREENLGSVVGPQGPKGATGAQGPAGPKGDKGDCLFNLEIDADGNLYALYQDGATAPNFEFDAATGNLYLVVED